MDWYEEPINPECMGEMQIAPLRTERIPMPETFNERFAREQAARIVAAARSETEQALGAFLPTDFYIQRFARKD